MEGAQKNVGGHQHPCNEADMDIFYAATSISVGNGRKTPFWHAPWLQGRKPIDIAPLIFALSKRKNWNVFQALHGGAWIEKIALGPRFTLQHLEQFVELWRLINHVHLDDNVEDDILWKLTDDGEYSAKSAYEVQFLGSTLSNMEKTVWKAWAPPKVKFFAWLATQNRIWTADRLEKRGWQNCGLCPLCKQTIETVNHLFVSCRYTIRVWNLTKSWIGINDIEPQQWQGAGLSIKTWWSMITDGVIPNRKALASLTLLITWELWNERNARVFRNKHAPPFVVLDRIKNEVRLWVIAGAKHLGEIMPGE